MPPRWRSLLRNLLRRSEVDADLEAELRAYQDLLRDEGLGGGSEIPMLAVKEQVHDVRAGAGVTTLLQDARFAVRVLRKSPGFVLVMVTTLALGIGLSTALFSLVNAVVLRPLPFPEPERLVSLGAGANPNIPGQVSYPDFSDWRAQNHAFSELAAYGDYDGTVSAGSGAQRIHLCAVTAEFFRLLRTLPAQGRDFTASEHRPGSGPLVIVSDGLWRGLLGSDPHAIGRRLMMLGGIPATVVGVMPPRFDFPNESQIWTTAELTPDTLAERTAHNYRVLGRLKSGVALPAAQSEMTAIVQRLGKQYPGEFQTRDVTAVPLQDSIIGNYKTSLLTLLAAAGFVLLIVCVNAANLLLVRGAARAQEFSVRAALGAGRGRLIQQLAVEGTMLSAAGGLLGLMLAAQSVGLLRLLLPVNLPRLDTVQLDGEALCFAMVVTGICPVIFGLAPAMASTRINLQQVLKESAPQHSMTRRTRWLGNALVISQVVLAFVLTGATALLTLSYWRLQQQRPGFDPESVLTATLDLPVTSLNWGASPPTWLPDYQRILEATRRMPGVQYASVTGDLPLTGFKPDGHFSVEGRSEAENRKRDAEFRWIGADYLRAMRIRLLSGRTFEATDGPGTQPVMLINRSLAREVFGVADPLGQRIWFDSFDQQKMFMTIVGVVDDVREAALDRAPRAAGYVLYSQHPHLLAEGHLVARVKAGDPTRLAGALREAIHAVDPNVAVRFAPMREIYARSVARERFEAEMLGGFALVALLLAGLGVYGVLAFQVQQTHTELAIRMAFGASTQGLMTRVLWRAALLVGAGLVLSVPVALACTRMLAPLLFAGSAFEVMPWVLAAACLLAIAMPGAYMPAQRAVSIEPMRVLRQ